MITPQTTHLTIAGRRIGPGEPCFVIAEAGVNHNGDLELAERLIDAAADAGADAVKFQTFKAEMVMAADAPKAAYQQRTTGSEGSQLDMVRALELPFEGFAQLAARCRDKGVLFLSTPFDHASVDILEALDVPAFKVPSGEITNLFLLAHIARKRRPVILSTGMATLEEVDGAVNCLRGNGCRELAILQCTSNYPAAPADANLRAMHTMANAFNVPVGYSDHTLGITVALGAVALGAAIVEKHVTLDRNLCGPDHASSLEPDELRALICGIRDVQAALGDGVKRPAPAEDDTRRVARRSLFLSRNVPAGHELAEEDLIALRPATGIGPERWNEVIGRTTIRPLVARTILDWSDLA